MRADLHNSSVLHHARYLLLCMLINITKASVSKTKSFFGTLMTEVMLPKLAMAAQLIFAC